MLPSAGLCGTRLPLYSHSYFFNETLIRRNGLPDGTDKRIQFILNTLIPRYLLSCPLSWQLLPLPDLTLSLREDLGSSVDWRWGRGVLLSGKGFHAEAASQASYWGLERGAQIPYTPKPSELSSEPRGAVKSL